MTEAQANELRHAILGQFDGEIEVEPVNGRGRYRFAIVSERFHGMTQLQRQDALWKIVDQTLPRDVTLDVSIILALTPSELAAAD